MKLDNDALKNVCLEVARKIRWKDNPVDEVLAKATVALYFNKAIQYEQYLIDQGRDPNIIVRAVRYIAHKHVIPPMEGNVSAFADMLEVLIELTCPSSGADEEHEPFLKDIERKRPAAPPVIFREAHAICELFRRAPDGEATWAGILAGTS